MALFRCHTCQLIGRLVRREITPVYLNQKCRTTFWERDPKGGYDTKIQRPAKEHIKTGLKSLKGEVVLWGNEVKEKFEMDFPIVEDGDYQFFWKFDGQEALDPWIVTSDKDHGEGRSTAQFTLSKEKTALFHGDLSTKVPKDGVNTKAGYCSVKSPRNTKSFKRGIPYDWGLFTHLVIRCRGDGRPYLLNIAIDAYFDVTWNDVYSYILYTRGGPYWQVSKIPFSKFFRGSKGRIQDKQEAIMLDKIKNFNITCSDQHSGPFNLELDYIALLNDANHQEKFAYELYDIKSHLIGN